MSARGCCCTLVTTVRAAASLQLVKSALQAARPSLQVAEASLQVVAASLQVVAASLQVVVMDQMILSCCCLAQSTKATKINHTEVKKHRIRESSRLESSCMDKRRLDIHVGLFMCPNALILFQYASYIETMVGAYHYPISI